MLHYKPFNFDECSDNSKIVPHNMEFRIGQGMTFTCESNLKTTWSFNGNFELPHNARKEENKLHIVNIQDFNEGKYVCHSNTEETYWTGEPVPFAAASILTIYGNLVCCHILFTP